MFVLLWLLLNRWVLVTFLSHSNEKISVLDTLLYKQENLSSIYSVEGINCFLIQFTVIEKFRFTGFTLYKHTKELKAEPMYIKNLAQKKIQGPEENITT